MKLSLITPCTRPDNLEIILRSIQDNLSGIDWQWWVVNDDRFVDQRVPSRHPQMHIFRARPPEKTFGAGFLRNIALTQIEDGWVYGLDDDTIIHPDLGKILDSVDGNAACWQVLDSDGSRIRNDPTDGCSPADTASFAYRLDIFPDLRWKHDDDDCDVKIFQELRLHPLANIECIHEPAAYYNFLRPPTR